MSVPMFAKLHKALNKMNLDLILFAAAITEIAGLLSAFAFGRGVAKLAGTDIEQFHGTTHEWLLRDLSQLFAT
jgi:small neutral amino acid transporter SnatA (MarC family)